MLKTHQSALKNLRLVAICKEQEYLSTDSDYNIHHVIQESFLSNITAAIWRETWDSNLKALKKLYVNDIPELLDILIKEERYIELKKVGKLLEYSKKGLENLKVVFDLPDHGAHIDTIQEDYLDTQLSYIEEMLEEDVGSDSEQLDDNDAEDSFISNPLH